MDIYTIILILVALNLMFGVYKFYLKKKRDKKRDLAVNMKEIIHSDLVSELVEKHYSESWKKIIEPDNKIDMYAIKQILDQYRELTQNTAQVYHYISGNYIQDPFTKIEIVKEAYDNGVKQFIDEVELKFEKAYENKMMELNQALGQYMKLSLDYYQVVDLNKDNLKPADARNALVGVMKQHEFLFNSPIGRNLKLPGSMKLN